MGVASCNRGREGLAAMPGICNDRPGGPAGLAFGEGGMARPSLGVFAPLCRLPGIGGRSKGAGEDILGCIYGCGVSGVDVCDMLAIFSRRIF